MARCVSICARPAVRRQQVVGRCGYAVTNISSCRRWGFIDDSAHQGLGDDAAALNAGNGVAIDGHIASGLGRRGPGNSIDIDGGA